MAARSGINSIDALAYRSWAREIQTAVTLQYTFLKALPVYHRSNDGTGFMPFTQAQKDAAVLALQAWSNVANITFVYTDSEDTSNIRMATNDQNSRSAGYAYLPEVVDSGPSDLYLNNANGMNVRFTPGSYAWMTLLHEIGHTLGLKHPGDYNSTGGESEGPFLPSDTDSIDYTLMSYNPSYGGRYATTPMLYDVQAIQYLYGANMSYRTGDDTYSFSNNQAPLCIWDAGGYNSFDFSFCTNSAVDLHEGAFSSSSNNQHNVSIAYGVSVRAATTGDGNDSVVCNGLGNKIVTGAGNDKVTVGAGDDVIDLGSGVDQLSLALNFDQYLLSEGPSGELLIVGEGKDTVYGAEAIWFKDGEAKVGSAGNDVFAGGADGERVIGGFGRDEMHFKGVRADYQISASHGGFDIKWNGGSEWVMSVERLHFSDGDVALDLAGVGGQTYRLYQAAFNRTPDLGGLSYWMGRRDRDMSAFQLAQALMDSQEFKSLYGAPDNRGFLTLLYKNALHRDPDGDGFNFWLNILDQKLDTRENILIQFSESPENVGAVAKLIGNGFPYQAG